MTLIPAAFFVGGQVAHHDPANPIHVAHAKGIPVVVGVAHDYGQGTATHNPFLGHPTPTYSGGSITTETRG